MAMWIRLIRPSQWSVVDARSSVAANRIVSCLFGVFLLSSIVVHAEGSSLASHSSGDSNASSPPWQQSTLTSSRNGNAKLDDDDENYQGVVTRFAPGGRVIAVEKAMRDVTADPSSNTAVAIVCRDGTVVVSTLPASPYLYFEDDDDDDVATTTTTETDENKQMGPASTSIARKPDISLWLVDSTDRVSVPPTAMAPFLRIPTNTLLHPSSSSPILVVTVGNPVQSQLMRHRVASLVETKFDRDCSVAGWARRCADQCQVLTQRSSGGNNNNNNDDDDEQSDTGTLLPVSLLLLDADSLWRVDPSGQFWQFQALAWGRHAARAEVLLREKLAQAASGNRVAVQEKAEDETATMLQAPASRMSEIKDWIANHLSTKEALRIATECVLEANEEGNNNSNNKPTRSRRATPSHTNVNHGKVQLRGVVISPSSMPRMRCFAGTELRSLLIRNP